MRLYLVRHGKAERQSPTGRDDDRPLRPRGIRQAEWLGNVLGQRKKPPQLILTSPIVRAIGTAQVLQRELKLPLKVCDELSTAGNASTVLSLLNQYAAAADAPVGLILVGHNPTFEEVAAALLKPASGPHVTLRTGEAAVIDLKPPGLIGAGKLVEMLRADGDEE